MNQTSTARHGSVRFRDWFASLVARYDERLLEATHYPGCPSLGAAALEPEQMRAWQALHAWCFAGAGTGRARLWQPWAMPSVEQRWSVAVLTGGEPVGRSRVAEALCRELDGSLLLAACNSRLTGLVLRLRVKFADCAWWRSRRQADPWDSGYLLADAHSTGALARFAPRRATLIVMIEPSDDLLRVAIAQLGKHSSGFRHPVRLLVVAAMLPVAFGLERTVGNDGQRSWLSGDGCPGELAVVALGRQSGV